MTRVSRLMAGVALAGLSGVGVAIFSTFGVTANPFGGADPSSCGDGLDCSASTFTATEASSGPAFAVSSQLTCAVDFGPGVADCAGTDSSGYIQFNPSAVIDVGSTRIQSSQVVVVGGAISCDAACEIRDSANGTLPITTTGGVVFNGTTPMVGFLLVAVTIDIPAIVAGCDVVTTTVANVEANDAVFVTPNFDMGVAVPVSNARVTNAATDEVKFLACDPSGGGLDPANGSYLFWVVRKA